MKTLKGLAVRVDTLLLLAVLGLILGLSLTWDRYSSQGNNNFEYKLNYSAELLAHGLPNEAAQIMRTAADSEPMSQRSLRLRRVLAEVLIDQIGDHEQALAELVLIRSISPQMASETEELTRNCMNRLGRVYDVQRRFLLEDGGNPLKSNVSSGTVIKLGPEEGASVADVQERLAQMGAPLNNPPKEAVGKVIQEMAGEILLRRAAKRAGVQKRHKFLAQVRQFESNLALQKYLEEDLLKGVSVDNQTINLYLEQHKKDFAGSLRVVYSTMSFDDETSARAFVMGQTPATPPVILENHVNKTQDELPPPLRKIPFDTETVSNMFGPAELNGKYLVFEIHEVIPGKMVPPELAYQQARLKLLEEKQAGKITEAIAELGRKEELKILDDVIQRAFFPPASEATSVPTTETKE